MPIIKRPHGRRLSDFGELTEAEKILLKSCKDGQLARLGEAVPTDDSDPNKIVRAGFLRFLLLGGDEGAPVHEKGVQLTGASIEGDLDLTNCIVPHGITLFACKFHGAFILNHAHITGLLTLDGSHLLQGLGANGSRCDGGVFLRYGFHSYGVVQFMKARIRTDLDCSGGQFEPKKGYALMADGIFVKGVVHLNEGFKATGEVSFIGAQIGASLVCSDGQFASQSEYALSADRAVIKGDVVLKSKFEATGTVTLIGAHIGGNLSCAGGMFASKSGDALRADGIVVKGSVFLKSQFTATGSVSLIGALVEGDLSCIDTVRIDGVLDLEGATIKGKLLLRSVGSPVRIDANGLEIRHLEADGSSWAKGSILNGFVYKSLGGEAFTNATASIRWLKLQRDQDLGEDDAKRSFRPQPWKQLQKVLREMGHDADAREVGVAYEDQLRKANRIGQITDVKDVNLWRPFLQRKSLRIFHWLFGFLAGYGYHPLRLFMSLVGVWLFCGVIYWWLAYAPHSAIGPTDPLVFQNTVYSACAKENYGNWMLCEQLPAEYTTFSPLAYSLDILLPLVDLGQEKRWGPLTPTPEKTFVLSSYRLAHRIGFACLTGFKSSTAGSPACCSWRLSRVWLGAAKLKNKLIQNFFTQTGNIFELKIVTALSTGWSMSSMMTTKPWNTKITSS